MKEGRPSWTAEIITVCRTAESLKPENERICHDPLAVNFLRPLFRIIAKSRLLRDLAIWYAFERRYPGGFCILVVRVRYIDDYLKTCVDDGIGQLVILGAGYDSRAYRIDGLKGKVNVFEVDHPATQKAKTEKLKKMLGSLPEHVVYVPIDFEKEKLDKRLFESGYDRNLRTLFIWEGVTYFIPVEAVDNTLAFVVNNSREGSSIIFDYFVRPVGDEASEVGLSAKELQQRLKYSARAGEPILFQIENNAITDFLSKRGFHQIVKVTATDLRNLYFKGKNERRKVSGHLAIVRGTVKPRG